MKKHIRYYRDTYGASEGDLNPAVVVSKVTFYTEDFVTPDLFFKVDETEPYKFVWQEGDVDVINPNGDVIRIHKWVVERFYYDDETVKGKEYAHQSILIEAVNNGMPLDFGRFISIREGWLNGNKDI